jgi:hypothetical protein
MSKTAAGLAAALLLASGLSACISPTPYQPNRPGSPTSGGYSETRIEPNRWEVSFSGNSMTSRERVEGYLLFRAAELTLQNGDDWFSIVDRHTDRNARTYVQPDPFYNPWYGPGFGYWRPSWRFRERGFGWRTWDPYFGAPFFADEVNVQTIQNFVATAEITTHKGAKPANDPRAFDAHAVVENLKSKIQYPTPRS